MPDFDDVDFDREPVEPVVVDDPSRHEKWIVLAVVLLLVGGVLGYSWLRRTRPAAPAPAIASAPQADINLKPGTPVLEGERIPLPLLAESDPLVRTLVSKLSTAPQVLAWLATRGLIENFAVVTLNISDGETPVGRIRTLSPGVRFSVKNRSGSLFLDPASYRRYDEYAAAVGGLDPIGTARLYLTLKPRILDAYRALGYPEGDFDRVLERAIAVLLAVPIVDGDIPVREKGVSYAFVDQDLESLSRAQKQLLRMGPANVRIVHDKLREIAKLLGLNPDPSLLRN